MYRTYIFYRACGCFLYAPSIYTVSLQKRWMCVSTSLLVQRSTSVYFAEHKFDRCQTCFYLIHAASVPMFKRHCRLNLQVLALAKTLLLKILTVSEPPRTSVVLSSNEFDISSNLYTSVVLRAYNACIEDFRFNRCQKKSRI